MASSVKQFGSATRLNFDRDEGESFVSAECAGKLMDFAYPGNGAVVYMAGELASVEQGGEADLNAVGGLMQFLYRMVDDENAKMLKRSLLDPTVDFDENHVIELIKYLTEEWSGERPTGKPSGSSGRQRATGKTSTVAARRRE